MKYKIILDLCGGSGAWSEPYKKAGYDVRNITLPYFDVRIYDFEKENLLFWRQNPKRYQTYIPTPEVIEIKNIYGILAAPPCTMFSIARTTAKTPRDLKQGMELVTACLEIIWQCQYRYNQKETGYKTSLKFWALENPNGFLKYFLGKPAFEFQPFEFGDPYSKKTHLWGWFNLPQKLDNFDKKCKVDLFHRGKMEDLIKYKSISMISSRKDLRAITPAGFAQAFFEANK